MSHQRIEDRAVLAKPDKLTMKQERFARHYVEHGSVVEAYIHAYDVERTTNRNSLRATSFNVLNNPKVRARVAVLQAASSERTITSNADLIASLESIVDADIQEAVTLSVNACRYCHGISNRYQWRDEVEYYDACAKAIDAGEKTPDNNGGYGFRNDREPNGDCLHCHGVGIPRVRFSNLADVSPGVRKLFKGIELFPDGSVKRVHFYDQSALRVELHRLKGMHIERSISVSARVEVPALKDLSHEQALDFLESLKPTAAPDASSVVLDVTAAPAPVSTSR